MDHPAEARGLVYMLDAAGQTIDRLERRVNLLEQQVALVAAERDELRRQLDAVRSGATATDDVPPHETPGPENGPHDPPAPPA